MRRLFILPFLILCCMLFQTNSLAQNLADETTFLNALQEQLQQQYQQYRNRDVPICYLHLSMESSEERFLESSMGSLMSNRQHNERTLTVRLLVGDLQRGLVCERTSAGKTILLPLDFNVQATGQILNNEVGRLYAEAENEFILRQNLEKNKGIPFESSTIDLEEADVPPVPPVLNVDFQEDAWAKKLNQYSALWRTFEKNTTGKSSLRYRQTRSYTLDNNGLRRIDEQSSTLLSLTATLTDPKGQTVSCEKSFWAEFPDELPAADMVMLEETRLYDQLQLSAGTHPAEAAICPALFSNEAAALTLYLAYTSSKPQPNTLLSVILSPSLFTVKPNAPCSDAQLLQLLKQTISGQHKEYGYWIKSVQYSEADGLVAQEIYKVYADGRPDERIRGLALELNPLFWSQITACGEQTDCLAAGWVPAQHPVRCCAPAILCYQLETREIPAHIPMHPLSKAPLAAAESDLPFSELFLRNTQDEIQEVFEDTTLAAAPKLYHIEYRFTDATSYHVQSSMGSTLQSEELPVRTLQTRVLVGNDNLNNENLYPQRKFHTYPLPLDNPKHLLADIIHLSTENAYIEALADYDQKIRCLDQLPASQQKAYLPDRSLAYCQSVSLENPSVDFTRDQLQEIANDLSARLSAEKQLLNSGVTISAHHGHAGFTSSQNVQYIQPFRLCCIQLFAAVLTLDGDTLYDERQLVYRDFRDLPERESLYQEADKLATTLAALAKAPVVSEYTDGPVLFSQEAVAKLLSYTLLESSPSLLASREPLDNPLSTGNWWNTMKMKQIVSPLLSITAQYDHSTFNQTPLVGFYTVDAEGVPVGKKTELIHHGQLMEMLSNRTPSPLAKFSNGHQRLALYNGSLVATPGAGVLQVDCQNSLSEQAIVKVLLKQARAQGQKYAYQIVNLSSNRNADRSGMPLASYAYRIRTSDGTRELVRLARTEALEVGLLNNVTAASGKNVFNMLTLMQDVRPPKGKCTVYGIPTSIIAPEHLLLEHFKILPGR